MGPRSARAELGDQALTYGFIQRRTDELWEEQVVLHRDAVINRILFGDGPPKEVEGVTPWLTAFKEHPSNNSGPSQPD